MRTVVLLVVLVVCCWEISGQQGEVVNEAPELEFSNITAGVGYAVPQATPQEESSASGDDIDEETNTGPASSSEEDDEGDEKEVSSGSSPPVQGGDNTHPPYPLWRSKHRCNKTKTEKETDWHAKFENLTDEQKLELMHKHHNYYANLTEKMLSFVNMTYHQMLQLPPRSDNATLCLQRAKFVKEFLYTLHKNVQPLLPGGGGGHGWKGKGKRDGHEKRGGDAKGGKTWPRSARHGDQGLSSQIKEAIEDAVSDLLKDRKFQTNVHQIVATSLLGQQSNSTLQAPNDKAGWGLGGWGQNKGKGQGGQGRGDRGQGGQGHGGRGQGGQGHGGRDQGSQGHGGRDQGGQGLGGRGQSGQGHGGRGQGGQGHADRGQGGRSQSGQSYGDTRQGSAGQEGRGHARGNMPSVMQTTESQQSNN